MALHVLCHCRAHDKLSFGLRDFNLHFLRIHALFCDKMLFKAVMNAFEKIQAPQKISYDGSTPARTPRCQPVPATPRIAESFY